MARQPVFGGSGDANGCLPGCAVLLDAGLGLNKGADMKIVYCALCDALFVMRW